MVPSTWPSIVRSSLPFNSPLMTTDFPIFTLVSLSRNGLASGRGLGVPMVVDGCGAGGAGVAGVAAGCPLGGRTVSSRFHMGYSSACLLCEVGALGRLIYRRPKWPV